MMSQTSEQRRPTAGEFVLKRRVQFVETDLAGLLHFSNYYRMMEEAECAFWRSLGRSVLDIDPDAKVGWPRVASSCTYFAPVRFEDELELALSIVEVGATSITWAVEFRRDGQPVAKGRMTSVCCAMKGGNLGPTPIPDGVRNMLAAYQAAAR